MINSEFAEFMRRTRENKGQTQEQAAECIGVTRATWITWEHGSVPTADKLRSISVWAGCALEDIARVVSRSNAGACPWHLAIAAHVKSAGKQGLTVIGLRMKVPALTADELACAVREARSAGLIRPLARSKPVRYVAVEKKHDAD